MDLTLALSLSKKKEKKSYSTVAEGPMQVILFRAIQKVKIPVVHFCFVPVVN
jgi:hypothetical protein